MTAEKPSVLLKAQRILVLQSDVGMKFAIEYHLCTFTEGNMLVPIAAGTMDLLSDELPDNLLLTDMFSVIENVLTTRFRLPPADVEGFDQQPPRTSDEEPL